MPRFPVRVRPATPIRRSDGVVQGYHAGPQVTENSDARAAFNPRPSRSLFHGAPASPTAPDLNSARSMKVGHRRTVHVTADSFVLEEWNGRALDYRSVPRTADSEAALRSRYPEVFDD